MKDYIHGHYVAVLRASTDTLLTRLSFRSPEQYNGTDEQLSLLSPQTDMWAFGATLLHAVTGKPPWAGMDKMQIIMAVRRPGPA